MHNLNLLQVFQTWNIFQLKIMFQEIKYKIKKIKVNKKSFQKHDCNSQTITYN